MWQCGVVGGSTGEDGWTGLAVNTKEGVAEKGDKAAQEQSEDIEAQGETVNVEDEARRAKPIMCPTLPSTAEKREHQLTHLPFRNWRPV